MRDVRVGNALGGHLRQIGLKLGDPIVYGLAVGDKDVYVDKSVEIAGKKLTYTQRYVINKQPFQEKLEIFEKGSDQQLFYYRISSWQDKANYELLEGRKVRNKEAGPKEAVRAAMNLMRRR